MDDALMVDVGVTSRMGHGDDTASIAQDSATRSLEFGSNPGGCRHLRRRDVGGSCISGLLGGWHLRRRGLRSAADEECLGACARPPERIRVAPRLPPIDSIPSIGMPQLWNARMFAVVIFIRTDNLHISSMPFFSRLPRIDG